MRRGAFGLSPTRWISLGLLAGAWVAIGFLPLFGGPGYEAALGLGLLLPLPLALMTASDALERAPIEALRRALGLALALVAGAVGISVAHGARVGLCDPSEGLLLMALGPGMGALMASAWGTLSGLVAARAPRVRRSLAFTLAAAGPLGGIAISLARFLGGPMIFAFDPFAGFFAGTLYDTIIDAIPRLVTYRLGSLATLTALALALDVWAGRDAGFGAKVRAKPWRSALALAATSASVASYLAGPKLGHYQTPDTIRAELGHFHDSERCRIVYASGIPSERVELLGRECDEHVRQLEGYFETRVEGPIGVLLFRSDTQKGALMGASRTYIAKPWLREVYLQDARYPHPVLGHELAHVIAGSFASGPFKVAGPFAGWIPDPGRIEGFAVAAAPREDSDQTLLEWSAALQELELLPDLRKIFRLTFLGEYSSKAYTVAGAFVTWLRERHGPRALRRWYAGEPLEAVTSGESLAKLEQEFRSALARVEVPARVLELARTRFDRPAIFARSCPHVVDRLLVDARRSLAELDLERAEHGFWSALRLDPESLSAREGLAACAIRRGDRDAALQKLEALAVDSSLTLVERAMIWQQLGDRALVGGDLERARSDYDRAAELAFGEHEARTLDVKRYATESPARQALVDLLIGDDRRGIDALEAGAGLGAWSSSEPGLGLADYLIARNLYQHARWERAAFHFDRALARELPLPRVEKEALRLRVLVACAQGDRETARATYRRYLERSDVGGARREGMQRFAARCGIDDGEG